jgi:4-amino-4-deoxy-L-arabinose transferase-like glycosyltransferase
LQPSTLAKRAWLLLFVAIIAFYLYGLGRIPLVGPDEPRYAEVAREMFLRRDFITPTLGGHTWFEKPALLYWMMIASFSLFGISEWAARLGPAISGLLTVATVFWIGKRVEEASASERLNGMARWSAFVMVSSSGLIIFSRGASFDTVVTMTVTVALGFFLVSELESNKKRGWLLVGFYVFVGLALLAKGLVGVVIPFGVVVAYFSFRRELPTKGTMLSLTWGAPVAVLVAATWYLPVTVQHGGQFIDEFFINHHFARYVSNKYHHPEPFYFYLPIILLLTLPWAAFLIDAVVSARSWQWRGEDALSKFRVFAIAWLVVPIVFFSLSGSKLPGYILPTLPAAALLSGERLARFVKYGSVGGRAMRASGAILLAAALATIVYAQRSGNITLNCALIIVAPWIVAGMFVLLVTRMRTLSAVLMVCCTLAGLGLSLECAAQRIARSESVRDLIQLADARGYGSAPVYALHRTERTAEFYAAGRIAYGADGEPVRFEGATQVANVALQKRGLILVIVPVEYVWQLTGMQTLRTEVIGDNGEVALVGVRAQ